MLGGTFLRTILMLPNISSVMDHSTMAVYRNQEAHLRKMSSEITWEDFKNQHGKQYHDMKEEALRREAFEANQQFCRRHNVKYQQGVVSFNVDINWRSDQYRESPSPIFKQAKRLDNSHIKLSERITRRVPEEIDWRTKNRVTQVRDQMNCDASWAFASAGALEAYHAHFTGELVELSPQNLIDCDSLDNGCNGGFPFNAFEHVNNSGGLDTEASYPYEGRGGACRFNKSTIGATLSEYEFVLAEESELQEAVGTLGPVAAIVDDTLDSFRHYKSGVYYDPNCTIHDSGSWVLVIGYGRDAKFGDYWLLKNSWGRSWGENGYMRLARNRDNQCSVASLAVIPKYENSIQASRVPIM